MGSQLNIQINALAFADNTSSNNPLLRHFDLTYKLMGLDAKNPDQKPYTIAPGVAQTIYDGTRALNINGASDFTLTKPYLDKDTYRMAWAGNGAAPVFRTDRLAGITTTSAFTISMNGPVATLTNNTLPFDTSNIQIGDILLIQAGAGPSAANQGRFVIIAKTSTSVSFQNLNGAGETFTVADATKILIFSNGGTSNQAQIGDKIVISGGFSVATQGTYELTEVTPEWIEFNAGNPGGLPLESGIVVGASGLTIYKEAKRFALIAAQQTVAVRMNNDTSNNILIEPVESDNPERAGIMIKNGSFFKLVIVNNGLVPANIIVATVE